MGVNIWRDSCKLYHFLGPFKPVGVLLSSCAFAQQTESVTYYNFNHAIATLLKKKKKAGRKSFKSLWFSNLCRNFGMILEFPRLRRVRMPCSCHVFTNPTSCTWNRMKFPISAFLECCVLSKPYYCIASFTISLIY